MIIHAATAARMAALLLSAAAFAMSGCSGGNSDQLSGSTGNAAAGGGAGGPGGGSTSTRIVRFIALGDTGTGDDGDPEHQQYAIAELVRQVCALRGCDFAVMAGDNIYEQGVGSVDDPLFDDAFEQAYANLDMPFYVSLGNHDNAQSPLGEGSANSRGNFQVDYTAVSPSGKWRLPFRYYSQQFPEGSATPLLELISLDSSPISHFFDDLSAEWSGAALDAYIMDQMTFVQDTIAASPATWKIALAHHPYLSNGGHGNAGTFDEGTTPDPCPIGMSPTCRGTQYKQFLEDTICDEVDFFVTGHDHELYWTQPVAECGKTHFILSGAAAKRRDVHDATRNPVYYQMGQTWGFFWIELRDDNMIGAAYVMYPDGTSINADDAGNPLPMFEQVLDRVP